MAAIGPPLLAQAVPPSWLPDWLHWFYAIGRWLVDALALSPQRLGQVTLFVLVIGIAVVLGKTLSVVLRRTVLKPPRVDLAVGRLLGHLIVLGVFFLGFSAALTIFGTDVAQIATGLGLLTLALGFGMQNTVANLMGGVSLAIDKPFRPGDRIEVGKYWGTVQQIGLRSTRILTPRKETVIVPNKILEEREIWNYTLFSPEFRLDVDVPIAYGADWRQAEKILLEVAKEHPNTLRYRPATVVMRKFGESSVDLQLRCWIADVTVRTETVSDLLKATKDRFDQANLEIPLPHRVLIHSKDGRPPARPLEPYSRYRQVRRKILFVELDPAPEEERATFVLSLAKALGGGVVGLFVQERGRGSDDGEHGLRILGELARQQRIWFKPLIRRGDLNVVVADVAGEEDVDLVLVGHERHRFQTPWRRDVDVAARLHRRLRRPVVDVPHDLQLNPEMVEALRKEAEAFRATPGDAEGAGVTAETAPRST
ncbi:MAG: mechanosensitive ion channel [Euryarchaeota archaeon]|nr:mechanosensitive ion channel [Euryarchaeota archaeon]